MPTTMTAVREGLATRMATIDGLRVSSFVPDAPRPPIAIVLPQRIEFDLNAQRGADRYFLRVMLLVSRADDRASQANLDAYVVGAGSIKAAIEADRTLGGAADTCRVTSLDNYNYVPVGDTLYLGADFNVEVVG